MPDHDERGGGDGSRHLDAVSFSWNSWLAICMSSIAKVSDHLGVSQPACPFRVIFSANEFGAAALFGVTRT